MANPFRPGFIERQPGPDAYRRRPFFPQIPSDRKTRQVIFRFRRCLRQQNQHNLRARVFCLCIHGCLQMMVGKRDESDENCRHKCAGDYRDRLLTLW